MMKIFDQNMVGSENVGLLGGHTKIAPPPPLPTCPRLSEIKMDFWKYFQSDQITK